MSQWHREHPELVGTDADPWMVHESYRIACEELGRQRMKDAVEKTVSRDDEADHDG